MSTSPVDTFRREAAAAQAQGDVARAEALYRACLAIMPEDLDSQNALCAILARAKRFGEAIALLKEAARVRPQLATLLSLVDFYLADDRLDSAENLLRQILAQVPDCGPALLQSAQVASRRRQPDRALPLFRQALAVTPDHIGAVINYARAAIASAPEDALDVLEKALARTYLPPRDRMLLAQERVQVAEHIGRKARGLPAWAIDAADMGLRFSQRELEAFRASASTWRDTAPDNFEAVAAQTLAALALGRDIEARATRTTFKRLDPKSLMNVVTLDHTFYQTLDQSPEITSSLPPLFHIRTPQFADAPIYLLSCDHGYWTHFAKALVRSIAAAAPSAQIHLHVIDATPDECAAICAFADTLTGVAMAVSGETSPFRGDPAPGDISAPEYYQAIRFVRFHQLLEMYRKPLCIMDVDGLMNRDLRPEMAGYSDCDLALRVDPSSLEPWRRFYAGAVVVWPTDPGRRFARLVAAFIAHFYAQGYLPSGIDQFALYAVYGYLAAAGNPVRLKPLSGAVVDDFSDPASCLWLQTGRRKWLKKGDAHDAGDDSRYAAVFRRFSD